jgi:hypothetical protein
VQKSAAGIRVSREGTFRELGKVDVSEQSSANILSFASLVDAGANRIWLRDCVLDKTCNTTDLSQRNFKSVASE